jgi:homoserine kinase
VTFVFGESGIMNVTVEVPATSANLGPGFDALGLALDLWNECSFSAAPEFAVEVSGEGAERLPNHRDNLIVRAALRLAEVCGKPLPPFRVQCLNRIPFGSGLGSSSAATLTGLLGANAWLGSPLGHSEILDLAAEIENHPDNVAPALLGGLVVATMDGDRVLARKLESGPAPRITVVVPDFSLPTRQARAALPKQIALRDAIFNISRALLVSEALRGGDLELLGRAMTDALHQPYRLPLIPGAQPAMDAARAGGAAVALSGAGPSLIAFTADHGAGPGAVMQRAFEAAGLNARVFRERRSGRDRPAICKSQNVDCGGGHRSFVVSRDAVAKDSCLACQWRENFMIRGRM